MTGVGRGRAPAPAVFLVALGAAWSVGNVGAVVGQLSADFDISLTTVGLLSGTVLLGFSVVGTVLAPMVAERLGIVRTLVAAAVLGALGNLVFALTPVFAGLVIGRVVAGLALGLAVVLGPVLARTTGGVARVALFGAAIQLGIAGSLGLGAILGDLGVDWRVTFILSAGVALSPLPFLVGRDEVRFRRRGGGGFVRLAVRSGRVWRLSTLFVAVFSVPLILGSWLVHYLDVDEGMAAAAAGALSFVMFGVSAVARAAGGTLAERGFSPGLLTGGAPFLAAAGLAILALGDSLGSASVAVVAAGIGFAIPYGIAVVQAQRLYPSEPTEPVALVTLVGTAVPVPLVPLIGSLLDDGYGTEVFLGLALVVAVAGALNLRPVEGSIESSRSV
ncbi:MAG TPA: MFS transporter [Gaiellaceae bacterium]|nr:MFS transporter [Gaiellaceae bacterium]